MCYIRNIFNLIIKMNIFILLRFRKLMFFRLNLLVLFLSKWEVKIEDFEFGVK